MQAPSATRGRHAKRWVGAIESVEELEPCARGKDHDLYAATDLTSVTRRPIERSTGFGRVLDRIPQPSRGPWKPSLTSGGRRAVRGAEQLVARSCPKLRHDGKYNCRVCASRKDAYPCNDLVCCQASLRRQLQSRKVGFSMYVLGLRVVFEVMASPRPVVAAKLTRVCLISKPTRSSDRVPI